MQTLGTLKIAWTVPFRYLSVQARNIETAAIDTFAVGCITSRANPRRVDIIHCSIRFISTDIAAVLLCPNRARASSSSNALYVMLVSWCWSRSTLLDNVLEKMHKSQRYATLSIVEACRIIHSLAFVSLLLIDALQHPFFESSWGTVTHNAAGFVFQLMHVSRLHENDWKASI